MRFIGDIHAEIATYLHFTDNCLASIQLGDFGIGFAEMPVVGLGHQFLRGNHDSPELCKKHPAWLPDGHYDPKLRLFVVGGAHSIDRWCRIEGRDWWREEELSYLQADFVVEAYARHKPSVVVSHAAPTSIARRLVSQPRSVTETLLQRLLEIQPPDLWVFAHYHTSFRKSLYGTAFVCVDEGSAVEIALEGE